MTGTLLLQSAIAGLTNGFVYALIGLGISVIFRGTRIINAMQGDFSLIAGLVAFVALEKVRLPAPLAFVGGIVAGGLAGWLVDLLCVGPTRRRGGDEDSYLLVTLGIAFAISSGVLLFLGRDTNVLTGIGGESLIDVGDAAIRTHAVWLMVISAAVMGAIWVFYNRTRLGLSMLAASVDPDGASTIGINVPLMRTLTFVLGGLLGGLAGVLVSPLITIHYEMGLLLTLKGFAAAILGGLLNPFGAIVGGITLGLVESLAVVAVSSGYKDVISMGILIVIMILMPNGILGRKSRAGG